MRRLVWIVGPVLVLTAVALWLRRDSAGDGVTYRFVPVERGNLESVVSATGALEAVSTVSVGTQVSGIIADIFVDFNDRVRPGQVIAVIDTTLLAGAVREARANVERTKAEREYRERDFERIRSLHGDGLAADTELNLAQYNLDAARANAASAEVGLERARHNLDYATIRSPISGVVIERDVDPGQTVAASFSAPQLFVLAEDLSRMRILASVDESDIGQIREGQAARFTVQAYPEESFPATVRQVRMQSSTQENVVSYTVVLDVENRDGRLLPGMTATVDFVLGTAENVLKVANAALRFRPPPDVLAALQERRERDAAAMPDSVRARIAERRGERPGGGTGGSPGSAEASGRSPAGRSGSLLWFLDDAGRLRPARVRTGITDGRFTEVEGTEIREGLQVISGASGGAANGGGSPFQAQQPGGRMAGGGF